MKRQKLRLDELLIEKELYPSKTRAQRAIMAGLVLVNEQKIDKPGKTVAADSAIRILGEEHPYVSRGGMKLEKALLEFAVETKERVGLDVGASTGGFTDCLLQHGAKLVYAVDVGYGDLAWKLRNDPRVILLEKTNIRNLNWDKILTAASRSPSAVSRKSLAARLPDGQVSHPRPNLAVIDVSFISLAKVLPAVIDILEKPAEIIALIKPQFEAGKDQVGKGGIVREAAVHEEVLAKVKLGAEKLGLEIKGVIESPVAGADGNKEFLIYLKSV